jgi:hypothetical protein
VTKYKTFKIIFDKTQIGPYSDVKNKELFFDFYNSICKKGRYYYNNYDLKDDRNFLIALGIYDTNKE